MAYPDTPGWRRNATGSTSREAALAVKVRAPSQAKLCLQVVADTGAASCEEIAVALAGRGSPVLLSSIRGRCTELHHKGKLRPSGQFGKGESGRSRSIRWEVVPAIAPPPPAPAVEAHP